MSLGHPFDESGARLQIIVGASAVVAVTLAVFLALLLSARTLGDTLTLHIMVRSPGSLHSGAPVHLGGETIGEVVAIRDRRLRSGLVPVPAAPDDAATVEIEARVRRERQRFLHRNSAFFAWSPNVLTEAVLEIGPPPAGAAPGPAVQDGDRLRGQDPAEIGQLLQRVHASLETVMQVTAELSDDWDALRQALSALDRTGAALLPPDQLDGIARQGGQALTTARALRQALAQDDAGPRVRALAQELSQILDRLHPELRSAAARMDLAQGRVQALLRDLGPARRQQVLETVALLRRVVDLWGRLSSDLAALLRYLESGRGSIGAFLQDIVLYDELKEVFRHVKQESWRVIIKTRDPGQRNVR